jgi:hypothetical protein
VATEYQPNPHIIRPAYGLDRDELCFNRSEPFVLAWAEERGSELAFSLTNSAGRVRVVADEIIVEQL